MSDEVEDVGVEESQAEVSQPVESQEAEAAPVAEQTQEDVWGHFRSMPEFQGQEDRAIAERLYYAMQREDAAARALQQYQSAVPVVQDYISNRSDYEAWKASRSQPQQAPAAPAPEEKPWWNPPQIKDSYKRYLTRDEHGREVIDPQAPMDARVALEDYMTYRAEFAQKLLDNPEQTLGPMVEKVAIERAQRIVDERLGRMQDEQYVTGLEQQNKDWLYDEKGNVSAEGLAAQKYIADAKSIGINGAQARWDYATRMVERDLLLATMQHAQRQQAPRQQMPAPQPQQPTAEQQNMEFLRRQAMRTASQRSSASAATNARVPQKPMTFEERLLSAAQEQGLL